MGVQFATDFAAAKSAVRTRVEQTLSSAFDQYPRSEVADCARYVALGGGHRWRAIVAVAAGSIFHDEAMEIALPGGCAVELAHAASLILDDLPSMDDAEMRRGKPCAHLVYPRWAVDMAPVFLVTMAYAISLSSERAQPADRVKAAVLLSEAGQNMIAGQALDVLQTFPDSEPERVLMRLYELKSGVLYAASAKAGAILCGASEADAQRIWLAGLNLGMSYQLLDDVADVVAGADDVGKTVGKDAEKWTAIDWLGIDGARRESAAYRDKGLAQLADYGARADWLRSLVKEASYART